MTPATAPLGRHGLRVGRLSAGMAQFGNLLRVVPDDEWTGVVPAAWAAGVRYFDVAPHYGLGLAERRLGEAVRSVPRGGLVVSTKVGRLLEPTAASGAMDDEGFVVPADLVRVRDYSRDGVRRSLEASLNRLGLDRVDLVYVHDPDEFYDDALDGAFPALEELRSEGVITSYGAGMNQSAMLTRFVERTDLDVVMIAGRTTLLDQTAYADLLPACLDRDVSVVAAAVFNSGILADSEPSASHTYAYAAAPAAVLQRARRIAEACRRHHVPLPAAAVQLPLRHPAVRTVCLGAYSADQVRRNAGLFEVEIPDELWAELKATGLLDADVPTAKEHDR